MTAWSREEWAARERENNAVPCRHCGKQTWRNDAQCERCVALLGEPRPPMEVR